MKRILVSLLAAVCICGCGKLNERYKNNSLLEDPEPLPVEAPEWAIVGEFNDWDAVDGTIELSVEGEAYSIHSVSLSGQFKFIKNGSWDTCLGLAPGSSTQLNTDINLVYGSENSLSLPAGTYAFYLNGVDGPSPYAYIIEE